MSEPNFKWKTVAQCIECWDREHPTTPAKHTEAQKMGPDDTCHNCGKPTTSGIYIRRMTTPTGNLVIMLQKMAKDISYYKPNFRSDILDEAARRLTMYRQKERDHE